MGDRERVAAEDRAAEVAFRGEERVAELEAEANRPVPVESLMDDDDYAVMNEEANRDLAFLSDDQLAETVRYGFADGDPTGDAADAALAELQTRASRAEAAEKLAEIRLAEFNEARARVVAVEKERDDALATLADVPLSGRLEAAEKERDEARELAARLWKRAEAAEARLAEVKKERDGAEKREHQRMRDHALLLESAGRLEARLAETLKALHQIGPCPSCGDDRADIIARAALTIHHTDEAQAA